MGVLFPMEVCQSSSVVRHTSQAWLFVLAHAVCVCVTMHVAGAYVQRPSTESLPFFLVVFH